MAVRRLATACAALACMVAVGSLAQTAWKTLSGDAPHMSIVQTVPINAAPARVLAPRAALDRIVGLGALPSDFLENSLEAPQDADPDPTPVRLKRVDTR